MSPATPAPTGFRLYIRACPVCFGRVVSLWRPGGVSDFSIFRVLPLIVLFFKLCSGICCDFVFFFPKLRRPLQLYARFIPFLDVGSACHFSPVATVRGAIRATVTSGIAVPVAALV